MSPAEYALMLVEIRFIEHDLQEIADRLEKLKDTTKDEEKPSR